MNDDARLDCSDMAEATDSYIRRIAELEAIVEPLNYLRRNAASSVLIDGTDIGCAVAVVDEWTRWVARRFEGLDLADALRKAREAAELARQTSGGAAKAASAKGEKP